ncbi:class I adenylate-forming enzyme family protein [Nocardia sp. NPDC050697]|uniref:class I adenylate-forming enzyme family protein n=1 Tax=Nocardia sp. NPDC050697 TaxID=3155158 RepID=UPI0033CA3DAF
MPSDPAVRELAARYLLRAEEAPEADAIVYARAPFEGHRLTWADIAERSDRLLRGYRTLGMGEGARCALTLADHLDMIPALLALWRLDATAVLIDPAWGDRLRANVVEHSGANFALDMAGAAEPVRLNGAAGFAAPLPKGTAMLGYTSGSTGDPKGIPFTHSKLALTMHYSAAACTYRYGARPRRIGCNARLSGSGVLNLNYTWAPFSDAATVVLPELTLATARNYWRAVEEFGVEQAYLFPAQVEMVNQVALPRSPGGTAPLCLTGSAPVSARLQGRFAERFGLPLVNCFGISEAMCTIFFGHLDPNGDATTDIGVPWLLQARLVGENGEVVAGAGEGELQLSGPTLLDYYYNNEQATAQAYDGRWFRTGDIVRRDGAGVYRIAGRRKHVVMKGGFSIYLNEVEEAALAVPGVLEAAAVPLLTHDLEDLGLLVRLGTDSATTTTEVHAALRASLGVQRAPGRVVRVTEPLPRTGPEKLDRRGCEQRWESETTVGAR